MNRVQVVISRYNEKIEWVKELPCDYIIYNKSSEPLPDIYNSIQLKNIGYEAHTYLYHIINNYDLVYDFTVFCQGNPFDHCRNFFDEINALVNNIYKENYKDLNDIKHHKDFINLKSSESIDCEIIDVTGRPIMEFGMFWDGSLLKTYHELGFDLEEKLFSSLNLKTISYDKQEMNPQESWRFSPEQEITIIPFKKYVWGAQFFVKSETIRRNSIYFYQKCIRYFDVENNEIWHGGYDRGKITKHKQIACIFEQMWEDIFTLEQKFEITKKDLEIHTNYRCNKLLNKIHKYKFTNFLLGVAIKVFDKLEKK